jgi:hypothetical protein
MIVITTMISISVKPRARAGIDSGAGGYRIEGSTEDVSGND